MNKEFKVFSWYLVTVFVYVVFVWFAHSIGWNGIIASFFGAIVLCVLNLTLNPFVDANNEKKELREQEFY